MSKHHTVKILRAELERVNNEIDMRIIKGLSYAREARRHKLLTSQLRRLAPRQFTLLGRSLSFVSAFMF